MQFGVRNRIEDTNANRGYTRGSWRGSMRKHERDDPVQRLPVPDAGSDAPSYAIANAIANAGAYVRACFLFRFALGRVL